MLTKPIVTFKSAILCQFKNNIYLIKKKYFAKTKAIFYSSIIAETKNSLIMKKILTLLISFPLFGMEGKIPLSEASSTRSFEVLSLEHEISQCVINANHWYILKKCLEECTKNRFQLSQDILEKRFVSAKVSVEFQAILDYCQAISLQLSQDILEKRFLTPEDPTDVQAILNYCQAISLQLSQNILETCFLTLEDPTDVQAILNYCSAFHIQLSSDAIDESILNRIGRGCDYICYIERENISVSSQSVQHLIAGFNESIERNSLAQRLLTYLRRLNLYLDHQNHLRALLGINRTNIDTTESITEINVNNYKIKSLTMLRQHISKHPKENNTEHVLMRFKKHCPKIEQSIAGRLGEVIRAENNRKLFELAILHVEHPYWTEGELSEEEIDKRWTIFFRHFISGAGYANYGKTRTASCSPDRACVEAFAAIKEPLACLSILSQRNAGPLTEEIALSDPNEGEVDAVYEMGINRAALETFEELSKNPSRLNFQLSEEKNIEILEREYLNVIHPKKTCQDDVCVLGEFAQDWKKKTYDEPIDFKSKNNNRWAKLRHGYAQDIYRFLKYKTLNSSTFYDVEWLIKNTNPQRRSLEGHASDVAFMLKELKAQDMMPLDDKELYNLYHEVVRSHFRIETKENQILFNVFEKAFPKDKPEHEVIESLPLFIQNVHRYLLSERTQGYTRQQFIDALIERETSKEEAESAADTYRHLLSLLPEAE
jgi:hypothetical protein